MVTDEAAVRQLGWMGEASPGDCPNFRAGDCPNFRAGDCPNFRAGDCPNFRLSENGTVPFSSPTDSTPAIVEAMAIGCRQQFGADYGLAVGPFPEMVPVGGEPQAVFFALASASGAQEKRVIPFAGHPATLRIYCAKHALNLARLAMLAGG